MSTAPANETACELEQNLLLAGFERKAEHAADCLQWLTGLGVKVLSIHSYHHLDKPQILVASGAPLVAALPAEDIAWIGQQHGVGGLADQYLCLRLGCAIRWEQPHDLFQVGASPAACLTHPRHHSPKEAA